MAYFFTVAVVRRRPTAEKWEWSCRRTDLFYSSAKNKDTERAREREEREIKTREKDVENTCVTGRCDDDDLADETICPDRTSSNLLLVRVENECVCVPLSIIQ